MFYIFFGATAPQWARASSFTKFLNHTQRRTTVCRTPLDEWAARRKDLYLTTQTHNRQTSMPPVWIEPTVSAGERPQTYALDCAATGTGCFTSAMTNKLVVIINSLKVPKIKKLLLYEMKFLVPNYSCLQNHWLGGRGLPPPDPRSLFSVLNWICWTPPNKISGYATAQNPKWRFCCVNGYANAPQCCLHTLPISLVHFCDGRLSSLHPTLELRLYATLDIRSGLFCK